jgi:hypothetical protein
VVGLLTKRHDTRCRDAVDEGVEVPSPRLECLTLLGVVVVAGVNLRGRGTAQCAYLCRPLGIRVGSLYRGFVSNE